MKREVLLLGDPALYEVSSAVTREELEELRPDIEDMFECLKDAGFGHGISAPQIGIKKRLICLDLDGVRRVIVNPTLELVGSEMMELMDDCLCFPGLLVKVRRNKRCIVRYRDENWQVQELACEGYLSELIHDKLNCKSRAIEFSTLQRCASHLASRTDVNEAYAVGGAAAAAAFAGETGKMIALKRVSEYPYQCITEAVDVQQVANLEKKVPLDWITPDGMQVTAAFEEYARPLILDEVTPVYVNGTPRHICL